MLLKLTRPTDRHEASRGLFAIAELLVYTRLREFLKADRGHLTLKVYTVVVHLFLMTMTLFSSISWGNF